MKKFMIAAMTIFLIFSCGVKEEGAAVEKTTETNVTVDSLANDSTAIVTETTTTTDTAAMAPAADTAMAK